MSSDQNEPTGPDFGRGVPLSELPEGGMVGGHVEGKPVLLARRGDEIFAVGGQCTHYGGPLAEGLLVGDTVRCPWHHACFSLRTGEAVRAPALAPLPRWTVERRDGLVYVTGEAQGPAPAEPSRGAGTTSGAERPVPSSVVIVGAGAAGDAAAEMLRREGYRGPVTLVGADESAPYDRPNLSKDYLAGSAPEEWIPLRPASFYEEHGITLETGTRVASIDVAGRRVVLDDGGSRPFGALLLATGATPVQLPTPCYGGSRVHYLRTLADSRAIVAAASGPAGARRAVVLGASFIGLEVAASLRERGLEVHVVAPEYRPLERVMGPELGDFIRALHESHGVVFHMGRTASQVEPGAVT
jgi:nitrite reductase/ring-hydroxylating ferredoxin subunit